MYNSTFYVTENLDTEETDPKGKPDLSVTLSEVTTLSKLRKPHYAHLKNTVVADSSYVALCLGDYLTSLHKAEQLLMQPDLSGNHKYPARHAVGQNNIVNFFSDAQVVGSLVRRGIVDFIESHQRSHSTFASG